MRATNSSKRSSPGVTQRTIAFGHLHVPYVRIWRDRTFVNVASAGLPKDGDPRAHYAILTRRNGGWSVRSRRVAFDVDKVERQIRKCGMPNVAERVDVLRAPSLQTARGPPSCSAGAQDRPSGEALRRLHRRQRHLVRRARRRVFRLARAQRRGQDDDDQLDRRALATHVGLDPPLRPRRHDRLARGAPHGRALSARVQLRPLPQYPRPTDLSSRLLWFSR